MLVAQISARSRTDRPVTRSHVHNFASGQPRRFDRALPAVSIYRNPNQKSTDTSLKEKFIKIGAKVVRPGRYVAFQIAEVAMPKMLFAEILRLNSKLRPRLNPAPA